MTAPAFLTARWVNLCIFSWPVPRQMLEARLAPGLELDTWEGETWVSLVGFDFLDTRVRSVRIPAHVNFPELNLRFYVRSGDQRGVMFIREYVPRRAIATVARWRYNEPYVRAPMSSRVVRTPEALHVEYTIRVGGRTHRLGAHAAPDAVLPGPETEAHWFKEHSWGNGRTRAGRALHYRVTHPRWLTHEICEPIIDVDWALLYGPEWGIMNGVPPRSAVLAAGSEVQVSPADLSATRTPN